MASSAAESIGCDMDIDISTVASRSFWEVTVIRNPLRETRLKVGLASVRESGGWLAIQDGRPVQAVHHRVQWKRPAPLHLEVVVRDRVGDGRDVQVDGRGHQRQGDAVRDLVLVVRDGVGSIARVEWRQARGALPGTDSELARSDRRGSFRCCRRAAATAADWGDGATATKLGAALGTVRLFCPETPR